LIGVGNNEIGGGIGDDDVYKDRVEQVLASPSDSYSELNFIFIN